MYWPTGAPSVYNQDLPKQNFVLSQDGLDESSKGSAIPSSATDGEHFSSPSNDRVVRSPVETNGDQDYETPRSPQHAERISSGDIIAIRSSRNGQLFATITQTTLTVWQTRPTVLLASVARSTSSLRTYGTNKALLIRPDSTVLVLQTSHGYLITYSLAAVPDSRAYQLVFVDGARRHARKRSMNQWGRYHVRDKTALFDGGSVVPEMNVRFRMIIKIDAGISLALTLDDELLVATEKPAAIQCIRWNPDRTDSQTKTALLSRMPWLNSRSSPREIVYDRPMNMFVWITKDGRAYTVQHALPKSRESKETKSMFEGHGFHTPQSQHQIATKAAINPKFSLAAVGCVDGAIWIYSIRDYRGGVSVLRCLRPPVSTSSSGAITTLSYSPDGCCLFAGYEKGWMTWSVYGHPCAASFGQDQNSSNDWQDTDWLGGVVDAFWASGGTDIFILSRPSTHFSVLGFSRAALTTSFSSANVAKVLLQTSTGVKLYQGHDTPDLTTISADVSLWHEVQVPSHYLDEQYPIKASVVSPDGRYVAVAGQRGLAHYSVHSGKWKTFEDPEALKEFNVRGGMCWHQHILIAAVETENSTHELRLYSRETALDGSSALQIILLSAPVVHVTTSSDDSVLVYTYENVLDHYVVIANKKTIRLTKVGQIGLHGIIRSPARVRAVSWIVPDHQVESGDPSQDVATASVLFLVDGNLVLLQPSTTDEGELKYDMRVIAQNVEYYILARDNQSLFSASPDPSGITSPSRSNNDEFNTADSGQTLRDSLWLFDGESIKSYPDITTLLTTASSDYTRDLPPPTTTIIDFYPLTILLQKGIIFGIEAELTHGPARDGGTFTLFKTAGRTSLFIPDVLHAMLEAFDEPGALGLSHAYRNLPYFPHALEVLLHKVLDDEVENPQLGRGHSRALLPSVLAFLSIFPSYHDTIVSCTRKTELRSWRTLFRHLPPPTELFDSCVNDGRLKTAAGYLLILHTLQTEGAESLDEIQTPVSAVESPSVTSPSSAESMTRHRRSSSTTMSVSPQTVRLLRASKAAGEWDLCKEVARFLIAVDASGGGLRKALALVDGGDEHRAGGGDRGDVKSDQGPKAGKGAGGSCRGLDMRAPGE